MSDGFDPYREWLDLDVSIAPIDHYELLGLKRFESDPGAISDAADRTLSLVRSFRPGDNSQAWARLLDEITAAKNCLLDDVSRAAYDRALEQEGLVQFSKNGSDSVGVPHPTSPAAQSPQPHDHSVSPSPENQPGAPISSAASEIPGFTNAQTVIPGYPQPAPLGVPTPIIDPMAPLDVSNLGQPSGPAPIPSSSVEHVPIPGFANVAPPAAPAAPVPGAFGQGLTSQPNAAGQPIAMAQPVVSPAVAGQPVAAQPGPGAVAAYGGESQPAATSAAPPAATIAGGGMTVPPPKFGPKRSAATAARMRSQPGMTLPILVGAAVGLVLLILGGLYLSSRQPEGTDVVADASPGSNFTAAAPPTTANTVPKGVTPTSIEGALDRAGADVTQPASTNSFEPTPPAMEMPEVMEPTSPDSTVPEPGPTAPEPTPPSPPTVSPSEPSPPEPEPMETMPAQPSRADLAKLTTKLKAARLALFQHDFTSAKAHVASAEPLVVLDSHRMLFDRLRLMIDYAAGFDEAIKAGTEKLQAGESIQLENSAIGIVETSPDRVVLRVGGVNRRYELSNLPLGLAVVLAHQAVSPTDPTTIAQKACFVLTSPSADAKAKEKTRAWFTEAAASLPEVADFPNVMQDDYELLQGENGATTPSRPMPPAVAEPVAKPTRAEVVKLAAALENARKAIANRNASGVEEHLQVAESLAKLPDHQQKVWRLQRLAEHVKAFDEAMRDAVSSLSPGDVIKVGSSTELTVQRVNPATLSVEVAGLKKTYPLDNPPLGLAVALVQTKLSADDPLTKAVQAAFVVVSKNSDDRSLAKARTWYEESAAGNPDFAELSNVIDDDYDLLKDFQEME